MRRIRRAPGTVHMLLLSLLGHKIPRSGYELASGLRPPVAFIFPVKHSQIYPALALLERQKYISGKWVDQQGRPSRKVYRISSEGKQHLKHWLLKPRETLSQDEITLISYNINLIGPKAVARALAVYRRQCEDEKAQLESRWRQALKALGEDDQHMWVGVRSVYEYALDVRAGRMAWCDWIAEKLRTVFAGPKTAEPTRRRKLSRTR